MSILLRSSNYLDVEFAHSSAIAKGALVPSATLGGILNGFCAFADVAANVPGTYVVKADSVEATKDPADALAFAPGEKVYYNVVGAKVSKTTSDVLIGYCKKAAIAADTSVIAIFDGKAEEDRPDIDTITLSQISDLDDLTVDVDQITDPETLSITMSQVSDLDDLTFAGLADVDVAGVDDNDTLKYVLGTSKWTKVAG